MRGMGNLSRNRAAVIAALALAGMGLQAVARAQTQSREPPRTVSVYQTREDACHCRAPKDIAYSSNLRTEKVQCPDGTVVYSLNFLDYSRINGKIVVEELSRGFTLGPLPIPPQPGNK